MTGRYPEVSVSGNRISLSWGDFNSSSTIFRRDDDLEPEQLEKAVEVAKEFRLEKAGQWDPPTPPSNANLWRYLNFTQFISILERGKIWFTNVNQFDDPYEGTVPRRNLSEEVEHIVDKSGIPTDIALKIHSAVVHGSLTSTSRTYSISGAYVNCWNIDDHQSAALWEQYVDSPQGIAIQTKVDRLGEALSNSERDFTLGKVDYKDYINDRIPKGELPPIYHKRESFEHENEYRICYISDDSDEDLGTGFYAAVDLGILLEKIVISPIAPNWFSDLVDDILERYEMKVELEESDLYSDPEISIK